MSTQELISLVVLLPLIGGFSDFLVSDGKRPIATVFMAGSLACSILLLFNLNDPFTLKWIWLGDFQLGIMVDNQAAILLVLVSLISFLVHLYSLSYMNKEAGRHRYFAKLGFFTFSMLGLLISDNLILLFIFWELVGFASYLLIGFWYQKDGVGNAARIAFMVNRIADVALFAGILVLGLTDTVFISELNSSIVFLPSLLIAIGAFGKSAQIPFSGWLIKAMVGPTPVSALIHAATMVAAGVYLLVRVGPYLDPNIQVVVAVVGSVTALYGAISAITQNDIKKILAYSTVSQLGYMIIGVGVGAGEATLFHLWTHGFFKAGLFLGAGVIIHHLVRVQNVDAQDMRIMGGLRRKLPWTFFTFLICGLALAGIPFFSGFMSKEGILLSSWVWAENQGVWAYLIPDLALITIMVTAFYVGRMIILIFAGESRMGDVFSQLNFRENIHFKLPFTILTLGSIWLVYNLNPLSHNSYLDQFLGSNQLLSDSFIASSGLWISIFLSFGGLLLAYFLFKPGSNFSNIYGNSEPISSSGGRLLYQGFYFTSIYDFIGTSVHLSALGLSRIDKWIDGVLHFIAMGVVVFAKVLSIFDRLVIDGLVNLSAWLAMFFGKRTAGMHARDIQWQIVWLVIAIVLILSWLLFF